MPLKFSMSVLFFYSCILQYACDHDTLSSVDQLDIEGPSGSITQSGPWLIRIYHPTLSKISEYQVDTYITNTDTTNSEDRSLSLLNTHPLVESGIKDIYWSVIDDIQPQREIYYKLYHIKKKEVLAENSFTYRPSISSFPEEMTTQSCDITVTQPSDLLVEASHDEGAAAGVQRTLIFELNQISDGAALLTIQDYTYVSRVYQKRIIFPRVTLPPGRQAVALKVMGSQQEKCSLNFSITVNP